MTIQGLQTVVSLPTVADNHKQTIVQPNLPPTIILTDIRVPNIVAWNPLSNLPLPPTTNAFQPAAVSSIPQLNLPRIRVAPPPMPKLLTLQPQVNIAKVPELTFPKMPVLPPPREELPPTPEAFRHETTTANMPNLIAVHAVPPPPSTTVIRIPHLSITAPAVPDLPVTPVVQQPDKVQVLPAAPTRRSPAPNELSSLLAKATHPFLITVKTRTINPDAEYFGDRHVRTMNINMPNLSIRGGS